MRNKDLRALLAQLVGDEGPSATLFVEFAAKYGLSITDAKIPLTTELNVMLQSWRVLALDPSKAGFWGAIGFHRNEHHDMAFFGLWPQVPRGAESGYIDVGDKHPLVETLSGAWSYSPFSSDQALCTRIRFDRNDYAFRSLDSDRAVWTLVQEVISRTAELADEFEYVTCSYTALR